MKLPIPVIVSCLVLLIASSSGESNPPVTLEAQVVSERYCAVNEDFGSLLLKFEIKLKNNADDPIRINPPFFPLLLVARSVADLGERKKLEFELHAPDVFMRPKEPAARPSSSLIELRPGQTHQSETRETTVPTLRTSNYNKHAGVRPGTHFLQVVIQGDIVGRPGMFKATSQPIKINVEKNPYELKCE